MEIIQSSNKPIIIEFDSEIEIGEATDLHARLEEGTITLKEWAKSDVTIDENDVTLPLTQEETAAFPIGATTLRFKWIDGTDGRTRFMEPVAGRICKWTDTTIMSEE